MQRATRPRRAKSPESRSGGEDDKLEGDGGVVGCLGARGRGDAEVEMPDSDVAAETDWQLADRVD